MTLFIFTPFSLCLQFYLFINSRNLIWRIKSYKTKTMMCLSLTSHVLNLQLEWVPGPLLSALEVEVLEEVRCTTVCLLLITTAAINEDWYSTDVHECSKLIILSSYVTISEGHCSEQTFTPLESVEFSWFLSKLHHYCILQYCLSY